MAFCGKEIIKAESLAWKRWSGEKAEKQLYYGKV